MDKPGQVQDQKLCAPTVPNQKIKSRRRPDFILKILCNANDLLSEICVVRFSYLFNAHFDKFCKTQAILFCKVVQTNRSYAKVLRKGFV